MNQAREVIAFCDHWKRHHPAHAHSPMLAEPAAVANEHGSPSGWTGPARRCACPAQGGRGPRRHAQQLPGTIRQLAVTGLVHHKPTIIVTNDTAMTPRAVISRYAHRMNVEQRLTESIRSFHTDALSSAGGEVVLSVNLECRSHGRQWAGLMPWVGRVGGRHWADLNGP